MVKKLAFVVLAFGMMGVARADIIGIRVRAGYHFSSSFDLRNGGSGHLEGPELGVDFPLLNVAGLSVAASPSVVLGGTLTHGSDTDGSVFRFMLTARKSINLTGLYGQVGMGVGHTEPKSGVNAFSGDNGFITSITIGAPIALTFIPGIHASFEGTYYHSASSQLTGFTLGLAVSF